MSLASGSLAALPVPAASAACPAIAPVRYPSPRPTRFTAYRSADSARPSRCACAASTATPPLVHISASASPSSWWYVLSSPVRWTSAATTAAPSFTVHSASPIRSCQLGRSTHPVMTYTASRAAANAAIGAGSGSTAAPATCSGPPVGSSPSTASVFSLISNGAPAISQSRTLSPARFSNGATANRGGGGRHTGTSVDSTAEAPAGLGGAPGGGGRTPGRTGGGSGAS